LSLHYGNMGLHTWINYALSEVKGFTSYPISNLRDVESESFDPAAREPKAKPPSPMDFNQKHRGNALMSYQFDGSAPLLLRQTGLQLLFRFNSGHNFTLYSGPFSGTDAFYLGSLLSDYDPRFRSEVAKITTPWNYQFDFKIDRSFKLGSGPLKIYLYVQNLFNRKNVQQVYWRTGTTSDDGSFNAFPGDREHFLATYGANAFVLYDLINLKHRQHYQIRQGGDLFGRPREIRFGLQVDLGTER
jgi:hypothetical protein